MKFIYSLKGGRLDQAVIKMEPNKVKRAMKYIFVKRKLTSQVPNTSHEKAVPLVDNFFFTSP